MKLSWFASADLFCGTRFSFTKGTTFSSITSPQRTVHVVIASNMGNWNVVWYNPSSHDVFLVMAFNWDLAAFVYTHKTLE